MGAGIPRFASFVNCLSQDVVDDAYCCTIVDCDLGNGQHRNATNDPAVFTKTSFHHPDELVEEFAVGGLKVQHLLAVEGPGKLIPSFEKCWENPEQREWLLDMVRKVEGEVHLFGTSAHLMVVAT